MKGCCRTYCADVAHCMRPDNCGLPPDLLTPVSTEPKLDTQTEIYQQCYNNDRRTKS